MQFELGGEAFGFIRDQLSSGGPLANRLLAISEKGQVIGLLPAEAAPADVADFESGWCGFRR